MGRRINLIGTSGSGKTTVSRELARRLGVEAVELDALVHGPNWAETSDGALRTLLESTLARETWVVDGNYRHKLGDLVLRHAETVVWLDLPLRTKLRRLWKRTMRRLGGSEELWNGNRESLRSAFVGRESLFVWAIRSHVAHRRALPELLASPHLRHLRVIRLRSAAEVTRWLEDFSRS
jgi:adenylate kinase family enzyme